MSLMVDHTVCTRAQAHSQHCHRRSLSCKTLSNENGISFGMEVKTTASAQQTPSPNARTIAFRSNEIFLSSSSSSDFFFHRRSLFVYYNILGAIRMSVNHLFRRVFILFLFFFSFCISLFNNGGESNSVNSIIFRMTFKRRRRWRQQRSVMVCEASCDAQQKLKIGRNKKFLETKTHLKSKNKMFENDTFEINYLTKISLL